MEHPKRPRLNFKNSIDFYTNKKDLSINKSITDKEELDLLLKGINKKFKSSYKNSFPYKCISLRHPDNLNYNIIQKININKKIDNLSDLINLIDMYPINQNILYNINLIALTKIKHDLIKLNNMIGLDSLKNNIIDQILYYIQNLHSFEKNNSDFMHTVLYGPIGTGKTEIAKIIGTIFSKINVLKGNKFKKVIRADMIAGYLGSNSY